MEILAEIVENGSKWLEMNELKRFRHAQIDSETLRKIWIFHPDPTGLDSDLPELGEPSIDFEHVRSENEKNPRFFNFSDLTCSKSGKKGFPG